jgi:16S rRNA (guanine966-N2)-methyltransferase
MLFNSLGDRVVGAAVLDCYAGSGAVGLEALSRGASWCVFIENDHGALRALRANIKALGFSDRTQVWEANVRTSLEKLVEDGRHFDLVFADPPFTHPTETHEFCRRMDLAEELVRGENGSGLVILQHHRKATLNGMAHFRVRKEKKAGESVLAFLEPSQDASGVEALVSQDGAQ